jgi:tetratricopeptide (TPR) repeat protein
MARIAALCPTMALLALAAAAHPARAEEAVTIIGTSPAAACAAAAAAAKRTGTAARADLATCDRAVETSPSPATDLAVSLVNRSVLHIVRDELAAAIADTDASLRLDPALPEAYLDRGIALSARHQSAAAIGDFTQSLRCNLSKPELAYFARAEAREETGDLGGAYRDYTQAAALNPDWARPREELSRFTVVHSPAS